MTTFDPYESWLEIPADQQPPNFYTLLGVEQFDDSAARITAAAGERLVQLARHTEGPYSATATAVGAEIKGARDCLLNVQKKRAYDAELRGEDANAILSMPQRRPTREESRRISPRVAMIAFSFLALTIWAVSQMFFATGPIAPETETAQHVTADRIVAQKQPLPPLPPAPKEPPILEFEASATDTIEARVTDIQDAEPTKDVLKLVDVKRDVIAGSWSITYDGAKFSLDAPQSTAPSVLQVPIHLLGDYQITADVRLRPTLETVDDERRGTLSFDLWVADRPVRLTIDQPTANGTLVSGIHDLAGRKLEETANAHIGRLLGDKKTVRLVCKVNGSEVRVSVDGREIAHWRNDAPQVATTPVPSKKRMLAIRAHGLQGVRLTNLEFESIRRKTLSTVAATQSQRTPRVEVPDSSKIMAATRRFREIFGPQIIAAKTSQQRLELALKLLETGGNLGDDYASRYVVYDNARRLAGKNGGVGLSFRITSVMAETFLIDDSQLNHKTVVEASRTTLDADQRTANTRATRQLADRLISENRYPEAVRLLDVLANSNLGDVNITKEVRRQRSRSVQLQMRWQMLQSSIKTLQTDAENPQANEALGRFHAFSKGEWEQGLSYLAHSDIPAIANAARLDLARPTTPRAQRVVADAWAAVARMASLAEREVILARSQHWLDIAMGKQPTTGQHEQPLEITVAPTDDDVIELPPGITGLKGRHRQFRKDLLKAYGGDARSENAAAQALEWLARHQLPDGSWSANHQFASQCKGECRDPGSSDESLNGTTGLALRPFLASGVITSGGPYHEVLSKGADFLVGRLDVSGTPGSLTEFGASIDDQSHAAAALAETFALTGNDKYRQAAQATIDYIAKSQSQQGGWGFLAGGKAETRHFSGPMDALTTAGWSGLHVSHETMGKATVFLNSGQLNRAPGRQNANARPDQRDQNSYWSVNPKAQTGSNRESKDAAMSEYAVAGLLGRVYMGWKRDQSEIQEGLKRVQTLGPSETDIEFNYAATQFVFQQGGDAWKTWNGQMKKILVRDQGRGGHSRGSWYFGEARKGTVHSRLRHTAMAAMIMQTYYRQPNIHDVTGQKQQQSQATATVPRARTRQR